MYASFGSSLFDLMKHCNFFFFFYVCIALHVTYAFNVMYAIHVVCNYECFDVLNMMYVMYVVHVPSIIIPKRNFSTKTQLCLLLVTSSCCVCFFFSISITVLWTFNAPFWHNFQVRFVQSHTTQHAFGQFFGIISLDDERQINR